MDSKSIPLLKLLPLTQEAVFKNMKVDEIITVSALSAKARNAINNARIVPKFVKIRCDEMMGYVEIQLQTGPKLCWKFTEQERGIDSNTNFRELADQVQSGQRLWDKLILCRTLCTDFRSTTATVFEGMNYLFKIIMIDTCILGITGNANELPLDRLIQPIESCKDLTLSIQCFDRNAFSLTWLLQKIHVEEMLRVLNNRSGKVTYDTQLSAKKLFFSGNHDFQSISLQHLANVTRLHVLSLRGSVPVEKMNSILLGWKQGSLPNLELIEHSGNKKTGDMYMPALLQGLDDMDWDQSREATFSKVQFFKAAELEHTRSLQFQEGRDIKRDDGMMGTVIPCRSCSYENEFVFVVWSNWQDE